MYRLAATLGWSAEQICRDMSSREFSEWMAIHRYFMPLPDPWMQTGVLASAAVAPYASKGHAPKPADFVPIEKPPQHQLELEAQIRMLAQALGRN